MTTFTETELRALMAKAVREVRATNPLAPSITNTVTQSFVANAQLAVGGSAAMVYLPDEGEAVAQASGATYINLGTLLPIYEETIPRTAQALAAAGKPWFSIPWASASAACARSCCARCSRASRPWCALTPPK